MTMHERKHLSALRGAAVLLAASFCLLSCSSEETQTSATPATQYPSVQTSVQPSASTPQAEISPESRTTPSGSPTAVPAASSTAAASNKIFTASAWGITFKFEHPSSWTVVPDPSTSGDHFEIYNQKGSKVSSLAITHVFTHACGVMDCEYFPISRLATRSSGQNSLGGQSFEIETIAMDLTSRPDERERMSWSDNVLLVTALQGDSSSWQEVSDPYSIYSFGDVPLLLGTEGAVTHVHFNAERGFPNLESAAAYIGTQEHWQIQSMIASFDAHSCTGDSEEPRSSTGDLLQAAPDFCGVGLAQ